MVPFDERSPFITSGIRIGTPAVTTRGMTQDDMVKIVALIDTVIEKPNDEDNIVRVKAEVNGLCSSFPLYSELGA
jgi:glycine hydroxymethyltransferase